MDESKIDGIASAFLLDFSTSFEPFNAVLVKDHLKHLIRLIAADKMGGIPNANNFRILNTDSSGQITATDKNGCMWVGNQSGDEYSWTLLKTQYTDVDGNLVEL